MRKIIGIVTLVMFFTTFIFFGFKYILSPAQLSFDESFNAECLKSAKAQRECECILDWLKNKSNLRNYKRMSYKRITKYSTTIPCTSRESSIEIGTLFPRKKFEKSCISGMSKGLFKGKNLGPEFVGKFCECTYQSIVSSEEFKNLVSASKESTNTDFELQNTAWLISRRQQDKAMTNCLVKQAKTIMSTDQ